MTCRGLQKCQSKLHGLLASLFEKWAVVITSNQRSLLISMFTLLGYLTLCSFYRLEDKYDFFEAPWFPKVSLHLLAFLSYEWQW